MKASNPKVMIQAYRLLVERLDATHRPYPLHLGVTEAGDGEDGRIKGAIGIGALLLDGLGDTLRVFPDRGLGLRNPGGAGDRDQAMSLWKIAETGDRKLESGYREPERELVRSLCDPVSGIRSPVSVSNAPVSDIRSPVSVDPFHFSRREITTLSLSSSCAVGPEFPPRVVVRVPSADQLQETAGALAAASLPDTPVEGLLVPVPDAAVLTALRRTMEA